MASNTCGLTGVLRWDITAHNNKPYKNGLCCPLPKPPRSTREDSTRGTVDYLTHLVRNILTSQQRFDVLKRYAHKFKGFYCTVLRHTAIIFHNLIGGGGI